ncbi:MAG: alcohol dehydrogenase catalytic domain-containing protein, partial [Clostridia bacterium]
MKAARVLGKLQMEVQEVAMPPLDPDSIRVKVMACAICGTDRRIYTVGDYRAQYPVTVGHEIAGVVSAVGDHVENGAFKVGDRVCVAPGHGCGHCEICHKGYPNVCINPNPSMGYKLDGGFAEYLSVPEHIYRLGFVNKIPENLTFEQASMSEIIACCLNAQHNTRVEAGDTVLVMGAGPAGIIHAILSKHYGAGRVIIAQRSEARLNMCKERFSDVIDDFVCMSRQDLKQEVMRITEGKGADCVFVCAPSAQAQESAFDLANARGRINLFGGLPKDGSLITIDANVIHYKELQVSGASSSRPSDNQEALRLLSDRVIDPDKLITHVFALTRIIEAFDVAQSRDCIKIV